MIEQVKENKPKVAKKNLLFSLLGVFIDQKKDTTTFSFE